MVEGALLRERKIREEKKAALERVINHLTKKIRPIVLDAVEEDGAKIVEKINWRRVYAVSKRFIANPTTLEKKLFDVVFERVASDIAHSLPAKYPEFHVAA